jgi:hypothetical protein
MTPRPRGAGTLFARPWGFPMRQPPSQIINIQNFLPKIIAYPFFIPFFFAEGVDQ